MSYAIEFNEVWKKYRKGEKVNSLRDAIPKLFNVKEMNMRLEDREFWAVKDVSFNIKRGDVVGVMGPNGAGKSTILKLLSRIITPNKGSIKINGRLSALIEVTAGFHPELTGRENVFLNGTILGMRKKEIEKKFDEIVEFSGVGEFIDTPVKRYSSGMFSRLGFSVAAHMDPDILLVDEVLSVGDLSFQNKCTTKIRELLGSGATIVLVSHQLNMIQSLCQRVILLQNGEVVKDGPTQDVIPHYQNTVYKKNEEELRRKLGSAEGKITLDTSPVVDISEVVFSDGKEKKEFFDLQDEMVVTVRYKANHRIEKPLFTVDIMRADGVLCCCGQSGTKVDFIEGEGTVRINFGKLLLAPGMYMVNFGIFDQGKLQTFAMRQKDIVRIQFNGQSRQWSAVFVPKIDWEFGK
jgi:lipopolysaccharide transport system ATP-binding protein